MIQFDENLWTEIECISANSNPYVKELLYSDDYPPAFFLCKEGRRKQVPMSLVVFRHYGDGEFEDDLMEGRVEAQALGTGSEEPKPALLYNLGVEPVDFVKVISHKDGFVNLKVNYPGGEIRIDKGENTEECFRFPDSLLLEEDDIPMTLIPDNGDEPFSLHLKIPYTGLVIRDGEGNPKTGVLNLSFAEVMQYTYSFYADDSSDRFTISFNNDRKIYHYIYNDTGHLSIRSHKDGMDKVGECDCEGRLALLLEGISNAVIKYGNLRWRINVNTEY